MSETGPPAISRGVRERDPACTWSALSEIGKREANEDSWGHVTTSAGLSAWVVADGLGGHENGEVASRLAVNSFLKAIDCGQPPEPAVRSAIDAARRAVSALAGESTAARPPNSTLVALAIQGGSAAVVHVGDSRLMQVRDGKVCFRTLDHNVREMLRGLGQEPEVEASCDPNASQLTRSLGQPPDGADAVSALELQAGDLLLLCSDGISQHLPEQDGVWSIEVDGDLGVAESLGSLVAAADAPRQDNYTAICISIGSVEPAAPTGRDNFDWRFALTLVCLALLFALGTIQGNSRRNAANPPAQAVVKTPRPHVDPQKAAKPRPAPSSSVLNLEPTAIPLQRPDEARE